MASFLTKVALLVVLSAVAVHYALLGTGDDKGLPGMVAPLLPSSATAFLAQYGLLPASLPSVREARLYADLHRQLKTRVPFPRFIGLGYNTNLDLVVNALEVMKGLGIQPPVGPVSSHDAINSSAELQETFAHFFKQGSAAERYVADAKFFDRIVAVANAQPSAVYSTGGNAALMADRLAELGCGVFLGGPIGPKLAKLLNSRVQHLGGAGTKDEVHLILEYPRDAQWGQLTAPRANRFIAVHDESNSRLLALEEFHDAMTNFEPEAIILSGLHLLDGQSEDIRKERVQAVKDAIFNTGSTVDVHFELASIADERLLALVATELISNVDSLGLNEQELGSLVQALGRSSLCDAECKNTVSHLPLSAFTNPGVQNVANALKLVFQVLDHKDTHRRLLTRIHFHYLSYHIVAERRKVEVSSSNWRKWDTGGMSVVSGSLGGSGRACGNGMWLVEPSDVELRMPSQSVISRTYPTVFNQPQPRGLDNRKAGQLVERYITIDPMQAMTSWSYDEFTFYLSPVLVCKKPFRTVGLGDVISSTGLVYALHQALPRGR